MVKITPRAAEFVRQLSIEHGPLIFHQSGGCCDGSSPMLLTKDEFFIDDNDIQLGEVAGVPFYMSRFQYEHWKHTELTIDVVHGRGASFSLEIPLGIRFVVISNVCTPKNNMN